MPLIFLFRFCASPSAVFEGWYWRVTLPGDGQSFALIYSIEDPLGGSSNINSRSFTGVGAQVMGPDDGYLLQYSKDVSSFWADRTSLALGATFRPTKTTTNSRSPPPRGLLAQSSFDASVAEGFQASAGWHQGRIIASEVGAAGDLSSTVSDCRWAFRVRPRGEALSVDSQRVAEIKQMVDGGVGAAAGGVREHRPRKRTAPEPAQDAHPPAMLVTRAVGLKKALRDEAMRVELDMCSQLVAEVSDRRRHWMGGHLKPNQHPYYPTKRWQHQCTNGDSPDAHSGECRSCSWALPF